MKRKSYDLNEAKKPKKDVYQTELNTGGIQRVCKKFGIGFHKDPYGSSAYFDDVHNIYRFCNFADKNDLGVKNAEVVKLFKETEIQLKRVSYTESKEVVARLNKQLVAMFPTKAEKRKKSNGGIYHE